MRIRNDKRIFFERILELEQAGTRATIESFCDCPHAKSAKSAYDAYQKWRKSKPSCKPICYPNKNTPSEKQTDYANTLAAAFPGWNQISKAGREILIALYQSALKCDESGHNMKAALTFARVLMPEHFDEKATGKIEERNYLAEWERLLDEVEITEGDMIEAGIDMTERL